MLANNLTKCQNSKIEELKKSIKRESKYGWFVSDVFRKHNSNLHESCSREILLCVNQLLHRIASNNRQINFKDIGLECSTEIGLKPYAYSTIQVLVLHVLIFFKNFGILRIDTYRSFAQFLCR